MDNPDSRPTSLALRVRRLIDAEMSAAAARRMMAVALLSG